MRNILVTGAEGFIGKNLCVRLKEIGNLNIFKSDINTSERELRKYLNSADFIFHLAGVNRPENVNEFQKVNTGLTTSICDYLISLKKKTSIILSSSTQAELDNPYGISKREAENYVLNYSKITGAKVAIYRLPNVFGKWSRPNYNSVVATFCYNIANDIPIKINDPNSQISLVYIDDIVNSFISHLKIEIDRDYYNVTPVFSITVGELASIVQSFKNKRKELQVNDLSNQLNRYLYATYLSFLDKNDFKYNAVSRGDNRGNLCELFKFPLGDQIFISTTKPGIIRGNHYHHTKTEKFCVISGSAIIRFRKIGDKEIIEYPANGNDIIIVDIPPGYTHSIENVGKDDMICLFWANELFNPEKPDTYYEEVILRN